MLTNTIEQILIYKLFPIVRIHCLLLHVIINKEILQLNEQSSFISSNNKHLSIIIQYNQTVTDYAALSLVSLP